MLPTTPAARAARAVGALLASTDVELPWWRVVRADGRIVTDNAGRQAALLRAEGVVVRRRPCRRCSLGRFAADVVDRSLT